MAPWGVRQGWAGVGEAVEAAALPRDTRAAPIADETPDEAPPPRRPRALSPSLPNLPGDSADARLPPAPWGDAARDGAAAGTSLAPAKRVRAAPVSVAARVLALVDAHERLPPSPFERWRERLRDDAENRAPRSGPGHAPSRAAGPSGERGGGARGISDTRGTDQARKTSPPVAPPPSLTWDQHAVFLQFPPTRRATADDLPRGLAPAMLTELYRRVEREQKRYFATFASAASLLFVNAGENTDGVLARNREVAGDERHVVAERRWRARLAEAAFAESDGSRSKLRGVAPRRATAMRSVVPLEGARGTTLNPNARVTSAPLLELGADLDLGPPPEPPSETSGDGNARRTVSFFLRRGDALAPLGADAWDAGPATRARDAVSSLSALCFVSSDAASREEGVEGVATSPNPAGARAMDAAMTAAAFACVASHAPHRRGRAWEVPFRVDAVPERTGGAKTRTKTIVRLFDPLPSRDLSAAGTRARAAAYWDAALRARLAAGDAGEAGPRTSPRASPPRLSARLFARSFRVAPPDEGGAGSAFAVVASAETASAVAVADYAVAAAAATSGDAAEQAEAFRWEDAARAWAASALAPRSPPSGPPLVATVARVAAADGTVVDVQAVDRARAARAGADPPPEVTRALLADWASGEETPRGFDRDPSLSASEGAGRVEDGAEDASAGGPAAEPWFHRGFDPDLAAATIHRVLRSIRETCAVPGRYVLAHRAGEAAAELYRDADADADADAAAAVAREPSAALPRRRGRPQTAEGRTDFTSGTAVPSDGPRVAAKRGRRRGARTRGDGAFAFASGTADDEAEDVREEDVSEPFVTSPPPGAGLPERPVVVPARKAVALPAVAPRARRGPEPGATYDFSASYAELVAETSAATETRASGSENDADSDLFEVVPRAGAQRPPPGQIPFTFAPRGEPPQPGARRARKMWTSLLAPAHVTGDAARVSLAGDVSRKRRKTGDEEDFLDDAARDAGSRDVALDDDGDDKRPIPGARYCHKFAHSGTCRAARCPFPHVSLAEARAGADYGQTVSAEARARRAAYGNLVASAGSRRRNNWAGTR